MIQLNNFSGRSFNNTNQYPVFPWLITVFSSLSLEVEANSSIADKSLFSSSPESNSFSTAAKQNITKESKIEYEAQFRKLDKPIGALEKSRFEFFKNRMSTLTESDMKPFMYGSHYSGTGPLFYYMVRIEPFAWLNYRLQGGRFDCPDRLFKSVEETWESCCINTSDVKELIPEFFFFSEFLRNR